MRRPVEVVVVVWRAAADGPEFLVLRRVPERHGYWNLVAGGVEWGEEPGAAAARELREESGLDAPVGDLGLELSYELAGDPPEVRARFAADVDRVAVRAYVAEARAGWEPRLDAEHDAHEWLAAGAAIERLPYPEPRAAVAAAARLLGAGA